ncbi:MAG: protein-L-isoaspartate O-methyltransferase [Waddliaceae bacterium]|nr:protein-L-isoaspartate O-methyltransferase [Waddliaceae bacterium]
MDFDQERQLMVDEQLRLRGITDPLVLESMGLVPRHLFVPEHLLHSAYRDGPLPIGEDQTISQPYIVALMVQCLQLKPGSRVLEIGTGSAYGAAVLAQMGMEVYTIERLPNLADLASAQLKELSFESVHVRIGDGSLGWPEKAPFDGIIVTAASPEIPEALCAQLSPGALMVIPIGDVVNQSLLKVSKSDTEELKIETVADVRFVPLIGEQGWRIQED